MKSSKGSGPTSKSGGMKSHLPASPGNNPEKSKDCGTSFSGKNMPKGSSSPRHSTPPNTTG